MYHANMRKEEMTDREIIDYINEGANFYISLFGKAEHMEIVDKDCYSYVKPKATEYGISIIYNVHIDDLSPEEQKNIVSEMKNLHIPIWLDLTVSDEVFFQVFGRNKVHGQTVFEDNDEIYMAILPNNKGIEPIGSEKIVKVQTQEEFAAWSKIANDVIANGYQDIHPIYHYSLCRDKIMKCYILYDQSIPVAVASIIDNNGIASLEFVATMPEMRRRGFAREVCERALYDAFQDGARIVTVRAIDARAGRLYQSMGFKAYNYVI